MFKIFNITVQQNNGDLTIATPCCPPKHSIKMNDLKKFFKLGSQLGLLGEISVRNIRLGDPV